MNEKVNNKNPKEIPVVRGSLTRRMSDQVYLPFLQVGKVMTDLGRSTRTWKQNCKKNTNTGRFDIYCNA